ncbi:hypothetical protein [Nitrosomonas sp. Is37]|uniref:hypothetical protein n=1 Tax=Nitrosomonas sp. Is37 TaxID=3080535 RepID=UPI00294B2B1E|nr:hypothetical protein [Nitrosomonas sp. Is37]MDV6344011.1 hypothetical protein [Nitrosomonas sp. Is37]
MDKQLITQLKTRFDQSLHRLEDADIEFCYAQELMVLLGYDRWENFLNVIEKAKHACRNSKIEVENHFRDVTKMVAIGSGAEC